MAAERISRVHCAVRHIVVVGQGMVGHRFVEALRARDAEGLWRITVFAEEGDAAYDRVGLTSYTDSWERSLLALPGSDYADDERVRLLLNSRVVEIDPATKSVVTADGQRHSYDKLVLATGSYAFVPPVPGHDLPACHVYRTLDDLDAIRTNARRTLEGGHTTGGVVIGGGLLGLEAANALRQFGLQTHVVEMMPRLMAQQIDEAGGALLATMVADLGIAPRWWRTGCWAAPRSSAKPTCRRSSNCWASTSPASATRWARPRTVSRSPSTTRSSGRTRNSCSPTTPRLSWVGCWWATRPRTGCCGRWSAANCPGIRSR